MEFRPEVFLLFLALLLVPGYSESSASKAPTVLIVTLVRNKAHTLPYFLSSLEGLNYPKERISFYIHSDHNEDDSEDILAHWIERSARHKYHDVKWIRGDAQGGKRRANETSIFDWPEERFRALMQMKEEALVHARRIWADYVMVRRERERGGNCEKNKINFFSFSFWTLMSS